MVGACYVSQMRVIALRTLRLFWETHPRGREAEAALLSWHAEVARADWATPAQVKAQYRNASLLKNSRVVFNVAGNKFRVVVRINYPYRVVYIRFVGTHSEYDAIDVATI